MKVLFQPALIFKGVQRMGFLLLPLISGADFLVLPGWGQGVDLSGVVIEVRGDSGEARVRVTQPLPETVRLRGQIHSRSGAIEVRVATHISETEVWVRADRREELAGASLGDRVRFFPPTQTIVRDADRSLSRIEDLLQSFPPEEVDEESLLAPDFLAGVTGEVLDDYEAWLLELEIEALPDTLPLPDREAESGETKDLPFYPDVETEQRLETGVDYDRFVFSATDGLIPTERTEEQIGRFFRWNFTQSGDLGPDTSILFENEIEANDVFLEEEMDLLVRRDLGGGDRSWWRSRTVWKDYLNDQGDPFVFEDFETRLIHKLSEKWERQVGFRGIAKKEYNTDSEDGYLRGTLLYELNYRDDFNKWVDLRYEYTREQRTDPERSEQDYEEHRFSWQFFRFQDSWSYELFGETYYRDYNQPGTEQDELLSLFTGTVRKKVDDSWTYGLRGRLEPRFYPTTEDMNTNAVGLEVAPFVEYSKGSEWFLTLEPRLGQVFHFGTVPDDIFLTRGVPRDKSGGDFRETGISFSLSWYPTDKWRINLYEDVYHRWFPAGETGQTAFYLFDFPRIADSTNLFSSFSIDYLCSESFEITFRASHTKQIYQTYGVNDTESLNVGLEATYYY